MRSAIITLLFAAGALLLAAGAFAQEQTGSIKGTILDSVTHLPVSKAQVSIVAVRRPQNAGAASGQQGSDNKPRTVITDGSGTFALTALEPAQYNLLIQHRSYPQAGLRSVGKSVFVNAGEESPVSIQLVPGAAISGHVYDEDGDPMEGCNVQVHPAKHPEQQGLGSFGPQRSQGSDGQYRIFGIEPGKFVVTAQCQTPVFAPRPLSAGPDPPPSAAYPMQFYPGGTTAASAEVIDLAPGADRTGVDFSMKPAPVSHINVTMTGDWRGRTDLAWQLIPAEKTGVMMAIRLIDTKDGTFQIPSVFPGSYILAISNMNMGPNRPAGPTLGAVQKIEVSDKPAAAIVELRHGVDLSGTVTVEGSANQNLKLSQLAIQLMPEYPGLEGFPRTQVNDDGTFILRSLFAGPMGLAVSAARYGYMKSASLGGTEITDGKLDLSSGARGDLRIVFSTNTATVQGTATPGALVMAASADTKARTAQADQSGHFKIEGLAPGTYRILETDQPLNSIPDEGGQEVTLQEGQVLTTAVSGSPQK